MSSGYKPPRQISYGPPASGLPHQIERQSISTAAHSGTPPISTRSSASLGPGSGDGLSFAQRLYASAIHKDELSSPTSPTITVSSSVDNTSSPRSAQHGTLHVETLIRRPRSSTGSAVLRSPARSPDPTQSPIHSESRSAHHSSLAAIIPPVIHGDYSGAPSESSFGAGPSTAGSFYNSGIVPHNTHSRPPRAQGARASGSYSRRPPSSHSAAVQLPASGVAPIQLNSVPAQQEFLPTTGITHRTQSYQPSPSRVSSPPKTSQRRSATFSGAGSLPTTSPQYSTQVSYHSAPPSTGQLSPQSAGAYSSQSTTYSSPSSAHPSQHSAYPSPPLSPPLHSQPPPSQSQLPPIQPQSTYTQPQSPPSYNRPPSVQAAPPTARGPEASHHGFTRSGLGRNIAMGALGAGVGLLGGAVLNNVLGGGGDDISNLVDGMSSLMGGDGSSSDSDSGGFLDQLPVFGGGSDDIGSGAMDGFNAVQGGIDGMGGGDGFDSYDDPNAYAPPPFTDIPGPNDMSPDQDTFDPQSLYDQNETQQGVQTQQSSGDNHHSVMHLLQEAYKLEQHLQHGASQTSQQTQPAQVPLPQQVPGSQQQTSPFQQQSSFQPQSLFQQQGTPFQQQGTPVQQQSTFFQHQGSSYQQESSHTQQQQTGAPSHHTASNHPTSVGEQPQGAQSQGPAQNPYQGPGSAPSGGSFANYQHPQASMHQGVHNSPTNQTPHWQSSSNANAGYHQGQGPTSGPPHSSHWHLPHLHNPHHNAHASQGQQAQGQQANHAHGNTVTAAQVGKYVKGAIAVTSLGLKIASLANGGGGGSNLGGGLFNNGFGNNGFNN